MAFIFLKYTISHQRQLQNSVSHYISVVSEEHPVIPLIWQRLNSLKTLSLRAGMSSQYVIFARRLLVQILATVSVVAPSVNTDVGNRQEFLPQQSIS